MVVTFLKRWLNGTQNKLTGRPTFRPEILLLEERITPATRTWIAPANGN
jgi:hypothetical protein